MTKTKLLLGASLLILVGFALLVWGLRGPELLWQLGLAVVGVAMLLSLSTQWIGAATGAEEEPADPEAATMREPENVRAENTGEDRA